VLNTGTGRRLLIMKRKAQALLTAAGAFALTAAALSPMTAGHAFAAGASTQSTTDTVNFEFQYPGRGVRYDGGSHANNVNVDIDVNYITIHDTAAVGLSIVSNVPNACQLLDPTTVRCVKVVGPSPGDKVFSVSIIGNDGDDTMTRTGFGTVYGTTQILPVTLSGWGGNDTITSYGGYTSIVGGPGDDYLTSGPGTPSYSTERIYGSEGNDHIYTRGNSSDTDIIYCDTQYDQAYTDWVERDSYDKMPKYFSFPNTVIPNGCDIVDPPQ
jgi:hypothetical protein